MADEDSPLLIAGGSIYAADETGTVADAIAIDRGRIVAIGRRDDVLARIGPSHRRIELQGRSVIPGLIDGHAHMDREGLKSIWPSMAGMRSIADIKDRIAELAAKARPGEWIVTMPIGDPPDYDGYPALIREGRWPTRRDLDAAAPDNPVYIRPIWGYWRNKPPLVSIANSLALEICGVDRDTPPPSRDVTIEKDGNGDPTGVFVEATQMPVVELTLLAKAPHFTLAQRVDALSRSMKLYNAVGTTGVFEGHGVAPEVISAYRDLRDLGRASVRASLIFSPPWSTGATNVGRDNAAIEMLRQWGQWLAGRGLGDQWLNVHGVFVEQGISPCCEPRARALPQTGWAGFCYDAALPRDALKELLLEAARNRIRVATIWGDLIDLFAEVNRQIAIDDQRWVWGHISVLDDKRIRLARDLGLALTTHTNRHIYKDGGKHLDRLGAARAHEISPLRSIIDAGIPLSFGTDNMPPSMFHPIHHAVARRAGPCGRIIAPEQRLTRAEALRCATYGGAYLCRREDETGSLEVGKRADLVVLPTDFMTMNEDEIPTLEADMTVVGGRIVHERAPVRIESAA